MLIFGFLQCGRSSMSEAFIYIMEREIGNVHATIKSKRVTYGVLYSINDC